VALLLDYDGTLAPIAPHPDLAVFPLETKNVLQRLSHMPDVYVTIISGRSVVNVMQMVISCFYLHWEIMHNWLDMS
jgi:trehalose 6-phosphate synthase/phosphatase